MDYKKAIFPIIGRLKNDKEKYMILATGFFIDSNGLFITAGHTFKKNINSIDQYFICFLEKDKSELIPVSSYKWISRKVYGEIERRDKIDRNRKIYQCGPEYTDIAVGKIQISKNIYFSFQRKRPYEWQDLKSPCYNRNEETCPEPTINIKDNLIDSSFLEYSEKPFKLEDRMQFARVYFMGDTYNYENIDLFNNCIELEGDMVKGNSGAPVINESDKVIGIILGGERFSPTIIHLSRYILKKTKKLKKLL
jgi:hypothetical protein